MVSLTHMPKSVRSQGLTAAGQYRHTEGSLDGDAHPRRPRRALEPKRLWLRLFSAAGAWPPPAAASRREMALGQPADQSS